MNLSSYLQMPPAPNVPQSLSTSATPGLAAGVRVNAGHHAGQDFANIMARQFQRLSASERPSFAAQATPRPDNSAPSSQDSAQNNARTARADDALQSDTDTYEAEKSSDEKRAEQRAQQLRDAASAKALNEADATLLAQVAMMAMPSATPSQDIAAAASEAALSLRAIALSPQMHIITSPSTTPNAESLTAFAQSMGLDEAAIQKLLGEGAPNALARTAGSAGNAALTSASGVVLSANGSPLSQSASGTASATDADPLMQALNAAVAGTPTTSTHNTSGLTTALSSATPSASAATQLAALGLLPDTHSATTATPSLSDVADMTPATGVLATNANATAGALQTPVPLGLSAAEVASIQHIEITTAAPTATAVASLQAAATLNNSAAVPGTGGKSSSTLDALSLLGGDVTEQSVSDLVAQFSHNAGGDDAQQQPSSGHSGGQGFGQALSQTAAPTSASSANNASPVATTTPMGEVYDQLSDKMATEMAARMHKQLSDGEWKMKFGLRPAHLGGVEIQLEMKDGKLNAMFQAENPLTRDLLQNSSQRLRDALENFGIQAGQMHIGQDSGHAQQNPSRGSAKPSQVGDNSSMQVKDSDKVASATESRNKANASLLDLYA